MKILFLVLHLFLSQWIYAANEIDGAKESLKILIKLIMQGQPSSSKGIEPSFRLDECEKYKINLTDILLRPNSVSMSYHFKKGCDIQGVLNPLIMKNFPADFKLRNLYHFNRLKSENRIIPTFENKPVINLFIGPAELISDKGHIKFEAEYAIRINPLNEKSVIEENLGGEIRISEIYGKPVKLKEKVTIH